MFMEREISSHLLEMGRLVKDQSVSVKKLEKLRKRIKKVKNVFNGKFRFCKQLLQLIELKKLFYLAILII